MRDYIILNGVNSNTITGLLISTLPPITKPKIRTQTEEIDGRDGDIVTKLGYSAYDKEIEIGLYGNFDINEVIAYFNTEGTVVFSNEADKYYNYQILDQIDYEKLIRFKTAKVKMHVQPFKYPLEETPVEINIQNVTGSGETISIDNTAEAPVTLALKGNTSQDGTPTPDAPVEVNTVTGRQEINIVGKNIFDYTTSTFSAPERVNITMQNNILTITTLTTTSSNNLFFFTKIPDNYLQNGETYILSSENVSGVVQPLKLQLRNKDGSNASKPQNNSVVFDNTYSLYIVGNIFATSGSTSIPQGTTAVIKNVQVEKNSEATTYAPYQSQSYELDLGKNLFDIDGTVQVGTLDKYNNGFKLIKGTNRVINFKLPQTCGAGTYTVSYEVVNTTLTAVNKFGFQALNNNSSVSNNVDNDNHKITFTTASEFNALYFYIMSDQADAGTITLDNVQLERGDTASSFAPYKTPIEVNYIHNTEYQDYFYKNNNKWYIKKEITKMVLNGSEEEWGQSTVLTNTTAYNLNKNINYKATSGNSTDALINYFKANANGYSVDEECFWFNSSGYLRIRINNSTASTTANLKTWLGNNNVSVYYVLADPEDEEITDNTLIGQLNALENARSYDTITHINQNTPNKPFIIDATAVQKGSDTGIVNNIGNIYAKPTIDVEGSGTVEIYLNGNQMFSVDLSSLNECILDTANLEAYNPDTTQLMNRQVTGDYSNFKINTGENTVKVSGSVTKATISNYTRWL